MDNVFSYVAGGSVTGVIFGSIYLLYKYFNNHRIKCNSECCRSCRMVLEEDNPQLKRESSSSVELEKKWDID